MRRNGESEATRALRPEIRSRHPRVLADVPAKATAVGVAARVV